MSLKTVSAQVVNAGTARSEAGDSITEQVMVGPSTGFEVLEQSVLECIPGARGARDTGSAEEALFVLSGRGRITVDGDAYELEPETGVRFSPGVRYGLEGLGAAPLRMVAVRIPNPLPAEPGRASAGTSRLEDQEAQDATTSREFRIVADPASGLRSATHFVGYIPTTRAPDHFHTYDEVIYVIEGEGRFTTAELDQPLAPGTCIQLPARTVHCLENTGGELMRIVAVFRPAGSPAAAYYPDGTPAYYPTKLP
jgi:quercetin dioxygenase-like cupin family protein